MPRLAALATAFCAGALLSVPSGAASLNAGIRSASFLTTDGVRLRVLEGGPPQARAGAPAQAPVIAFVPGWSMPAAIWRAQLAGLGATYQVAALDPRGQGESDVPAGGYTIERRAADIHEFISRYRRAVLVGWSLGALEALHYVHRNGAAALEALVLVDSSVGEDPAPAPDKAFEEALRRDRRATLEDFVRGIFHSPRPASELDALRDAALRMPLEASLSLFPAHLPRSHWRGIARGFRKPLLYAVTARFAAQAHKLQSNRPGTRIAVFERAGHALFVDEPERFNRLLAEFVARIPIPR